MARIQLENRVGATLRRLLFTGRAYTVEPPPTIPPNALVFWQTDDTGAVTYEVLGPGTDEAASPGVSSASSGGLPPPVSAAPPPDSGASAPSPAPPVATIVVSASQPVAIQPTQPIEPQSTTPDATAGTATSRRQFTLAWEFSLTGRPTYKTQRVDPDLRVHVREGGDGVLYTVSSRRRSRRVPPRGRRSRSRTPIVATVAVLLAVTLVAGGVLAAPHLNLNWLTRATVTPGGHQTGTTPSVTGSGPFVSMLAAVQGDPSCRVLPPSGATSGPALSSFTLRITNNNASTNATDWSLSADGDVPGTAQPWATASIASGTLPVGQSADVRITSSPALCAALTSPQPFTLTVSWTAAGGGKQPVVINVTPPPWPAPSTAPLGGVIGSRYIPSQDRLIFVEFNSGQLSALDNLSTSPTYEVLGRGYSNPEDVAVAVDGTTAYVTERNGALLRVDLAHADRSQATELVTGLSTSGQIVLDEAADVAYFVDQAACKFSETQTWYGRLMSAKLDAVAPVTAVAATVACISYQYFEDSDWRPIGLAMTSDYQTAYIAEQRPRQTSGRIVRIVLNASDATATPIATSSTAPLFYLTWADAQQTSLLVTERDPANNVWKVDVTGGAATLQPVESNVPARPSSVSLAGTHLYVCSDSVITQYTLAS